VLTENNSSLTRTVEGIYMHITHRRTAAVALLALVMLLSPSGCRSAREKARQTHRPRNTVFEVEEAVEEFPLKEGALVSSHLWEQTEAQSIHLLQLARAAKFEKRFHKNHDLTLVCVRGSAIVEVEDERYFVEAPAAVFVPRKLTYAILPHKTDVPLAMLRIFSPTYEGKNVKLVK
jgi:mannose-6-phosphate isomerase-like protein (cupin superfamily)